MSSCRLEGRFKWLLETMMQLQGIDIQELDTSLDYWEAKADLEARFRTKLVLDLSKKEERMLYDPPAKHSPVELLEDKRCR